MSYATQSSVEGVLGRVLTASEIAALPALLNAVDAYINGQTGRDWTAPVEATKYYDVERSKIVDVDAFVVATDKPFSVFYVDADENPQGTVDESDFEARPRNEPVKTWLQKRGGTWGSGCSSLVTNLAVKAFFGSGDVPADISYAAAWLAAHQIGGTQSLSLKSESIEGYSRTFADAASSVDGSFLMGTFESYREILIG